MHSPPERRLHREHDQRQAAGPGDEGDAVECHQDTGCLWRACDYGHQVRSGQLYGKQWDIDRLKLGVAYVAASLLRRKEDRK